MYKYITHESISNERRQKKKCLIILLIIISIGFICSAFAIIFGHQIHMARFTMTTENLMKISRMNYWTAYNCELVKTLHNMIPCSALITQHPLNTTHNHCTQGKNLLCSCHFEDKSEIAIYRGFIINNDTYYSNYKSTVCKNQTMINRCVDQFILNHSHERYIYYKPNDPYRYHYDNDNTILPYVFIPIGLICIIVTIYLWLKKDSFVHDLKDLDDDYPDNKNGYNLYYQHNPSDSPKIYSPNELFNEYSRDHAKTHSQEFSYDDDVL
ncbi:MAG: hypothetical protein Edafosvirus3_62 [Edafosvirus sp.]|uniref:Uncharacterized protein n=1 Tax=Edafosvirus sp. TaxID=2487765 RepID=A0A3G4ZUJ8_9VIRU|nr:MAG: hypothetical protein Edafosvirus3_62 [Edafosvirus sp.]